MHRATVFQPAIEYAEGGFPLSINNARSFASNAARLRDWPTSTANYLPGGQPPEAGTIFTQPNLARSFRTVVEGGAEAFYKGDIAKAIVRFSEESGGLLVQKDLDDFAAKWVEP